MALAPDPADKLDAQADGAFGGVHAVLTKRGGKGSVQFEGRTYTRAEWITRLAKVGGTLNAGEGQLLVEELEAWRAVAQELARLLQAHPPTAPAALSRVHELWTVVFPDANQTPPVQSGR